jgi:hypothetical protein
VAEDEHLRTTDLQRGPNLLRNGRQREECRALRTDKTSLIEAQRMSGAASPGILLDGRAHRYETEVSNYRV